MRAGGIARFHVVCRHRLPQRKKDQGLNGSGVRAEPNLEIGPEFLYDGCHQSRVGAAIFAQL
jgi:hypothetical protein